jgi:cytochrome c553
LTRTFAKWWRPPALALAAVVVCGALACGQAAFAQSDGLAEKLQLCGACHGEDGNSRMPNIPSLAGQPAFFVLNQLFLMREGVRKVPAMAAIVKDLKDPDLDALSAHFAKLAPKASDEPVDPALVKRGAELAVQKRCSSCHLPTLAGQDQMPRLAKQRIDYLIQSLIELRDTTRPGGDTAMSAAVAGLTDADLTALAHYAASH